VKLLMASSLCWNNHPLEVIAIANKYQLDGVEMWAEHIYFHQADPSEIKQAAQKYGILLTVHASSWDLNMASLNQGIREQSVIELKKSIDLTKALDAIHMTFHPGRFTVKNYLNQWHKEMLVENTKQLIDYAAEKNVTISLELMEPIPKEMLIDPVSMNSFLEQVGQGLQVTLDVAHTPLDKNNLAYLEELSQVNSIHLSDSSMKQYHVPLGEGKIDLKSVLDVLKTLDLTVVLEGMDTGKEQDFLMKHLEFLQSIGCWKGRR
jgi:sugar phosphate isomerase/epimerase